MQRTSDEPAGVLQPLQSRRDELLQDLEAIDREIEETLEFLRSIESHLEALAPRQNRAA
jgi:hypothetical protein